MVSYRGFYLLSEFQGKKKKIKFAHLWYIPLEPILNRSKRERLDVMAAGR